MAVPMQRPTPTRFDPDLVAQVQELSRRITELQQRVNSAEEGFSNAERGLQGILDILAREAVEDGINHSAEPLLRAFWERYPGYFPAKETLGAAKAPGRYADFLRLAGRVRPADASLRDQLLIDGLASASVDVRDAAAQAAEQWADASAAEILRQHHEEVPWLADYIERVIRDISLVESHAGP